MLEDKVLGEKGRGRPRMTFTKQACRDMSTKTCARPESIDVYPEIDINGKEEVDQE